MLETLNLGSFSLMTKHNDVNLSTAVSASATLSHDGSTNLQHLLNSESTNEQIVDKLAWVRQSHVLVLNLHIYVNGFGLHREEEQQIRKTVMHAKLWSQLRLQCAYSFVEDYDWDAHRAISFNLHQDHRTTEPPKKILHRLSVADYTTSIQPPDGVSTADLEEVNIRIEITSQPCCPTAKRTKSAVVEKRATQYDSAVWANGEVGHDNLFSMSREDVGTDQSGFSHGSQTLCMKDEREHDFDSVHTPRSELSKKTRRHSETSSSNHAETAAPLNYDILKEVIDLAIRRSIAERPLETPKRTKVRNANVIPLANLAPAIWTPSYQTRIAQRACLLPTIAHALSVSTSGTFRSPSLHSKIDVIKRMQLDKNPAPHGATTASVALLWCLLQRGLHDRNASNALRSMDVTCEAEQALQEPEQLLHEGQRREINSANHAVGLELHDLLDDDEDLDLLDCDGNAYDDDDDVDQLLQQSCAEEIDFGLKPCFGNWDNDLLRALEDEGADDEARTADSLDGPANLISALLLPDTAEELQIGDIPRHYDQFEAVIEAAVLPSISIDAMSEAEGYLATST